MLILQHLNACWLRAVLQILPSRPKLQHKVNTAVLISQKLHRLLAGGIVMHGCAVSSAGRGAVPGRKSKFFRTAWRISLSGMVPVP